MKRKTLKTLLMTSMLSFMVVSCGKDNKSEPQQESKSESLSTVVESSSQQSESKSIEESSSSEEAIVEKDYSRKKQEMPVAKIIDENNDYGNSETWQGDSYTSVSLGHVYLQDVIEDTVYDWGHSVLFEDGMYKMWWVRPAVYDAVFYAESVDLKNWTNLQRVISLSPNALNIKKYNNIKGMLGKPSVVHVGDTYFMYFEAPASEDPDPTQTVLEWDNQVMLATSSDGINWQFYSDEKGQPKPVVAMNPDYMKDGTNKNYGAGQPSVFYKDGVFYLTYCYVLYVDGGDRKNGTYLATSTDGYNFGDTSTHQYIVSGNGRGVTFNTKTNKYMTVGGNTIIESDILDFTNGTSYSYDSYDTTKIQRGFQEFIRNSEGLVDTETFYIIQLDGDKSTTSDWRAGYRSWDGYIMAVNPCEYANRPITLPNGAIGSEANLNEYRDRTQKYTRPSGDAIYAPEGEIKIDCVREDIYDGATKLEIVRPVYDYGSNFTDTYGEAWLAWNETYLYVYAEIFDSTPDVSYPILNNKSCYMHDDLDLFVDVPNDHKNQTDVPYGLEQYMICTDADNQNFIIKGSGEYDLTGDFDGIRHRVSTTEHGYIVEYRVPWHDFVVDMIEEGKCIGIDIQINDAMGHGVGREAMVMWSDHTGNSFQYVDKMGDIYLIK